MSMISNLLSYQKRSMVLVMLSIGASLFTGSTTAAPNGCSVPLKLDNGIIRLIDGTPKADIAGAEKLRDAIHLLQFGDRSGKGTISFENKPYTTLSLEALERQNPKRKGLKEALDAGISHFEKISKGYLAQASSFRSQMCALIQQWAQARHIKSSVLLEWSRQSSGQEYRQLRMLVTTFRAFNEFLTHLSCFLQDFCYSCEKSWKVYLQSRRNKSS